MMNTALLLSLFACLSLVESDFLFNTDFDIPWNQIGDCKVDCEKLYHDSPIEIEGCSSGCRFYSLAEMLAKTADLDVSIIAKACTSSCHDSIPGETPQTKACLSACDAMSKPKKDEEKRPQDLTITSSSFSFSFFFDDGNGVQELQSDGVPLVPEVKDREISSFDENKGIDFEPDDVLTDPALRGQTGAIGIFSDVKLPFMKVKTLPVEEFPLSDENKSDDDFYQCWWLPLDIIRIIRYVPACIMLGGLVLMLVILLKLVFLVCIYKRARPAFFAENGADLLAEDISGAKYALFASEKDGDLNTATTFDKVPPPKYDEVVVIDSDVKLTTANQEKSNVETI